MTPSRFVSIAQVCTLVSITSYIASCKEASVSEVQVEVDRVDVSPTSMSVEAGSNVTLTATPKSPGGASLTARTVTFTSSAPLTAEVVANGQTGLVRGINPGSAIITARSGSATANVIVTVTARPRIGFSQANMRFDGVPTGAEPPAQIVQVINIGGGSLGAISLQGIQYAGAAQGWLTATADNSTTPATVRLQVTTGSLPVGAHNATVRVAATQADNSPASINVEFVVACPLAAVPVGARVVTCFSASVTPNVWGGTFLEVAVAQPPETTNGAFTRTRLNHDYILASPTGWVKLGPNDINVPPGQSAYVFQAEYNGSVWNDMLRTHLDAPGGPRDVAIVVYYMP